MSDDDEDDASCLSSTDRIKLRHVKIGRGVEVLASIFSPCLELDA